MTIHLICYVLFSIVLLFYIVRAKENCREYKILYYFISWQSQTFPKQPHWMLLTCSLGATIQTVTQDGAAVRWSGARVRSPLPVIGNHLWSAFTDGLLRMNHICVYLPLRACCVLYSNSINLNLILSWDIKVWGLEMTLDLNFFWDGCTKVPQYNLDL